MSSTAATSEFVSDSKLQQLFLSMIHELYWCEQYLMTVLGVMEHAASSDDLRHAFKKHRGDTQTHLSRLDEVCTLMAVRPVPERSAGLQGLFDEGRQVIDETEEGSAHRDAALIITAQKIEHYEIASYGSLVTLAHTLGRTDVAEVLIETLTEEKETDALLTTIARAQVNTEASREQ